MITSCFGFINGKKINEDNFDYRKFTEEYPDIDVYELEKNNNDSQLLFYDTSTVNMCFITDKEFCRRKPYLYNTDNLLIDIVINGEHDLVEITKDFKEIIGVFKVSSTSILFSYKLNRGFKINGMYVSFKKLKKYIQKHSDEERLVWNSPE